MKHRFDWERENRPPPAHPLHKPARHDRNSEFYDLFQPIPDPRSANFRRLVDFCEQNSTEVLAALPFFLAELAGLYGFAKMLTFLRRNSGRRIKLPDDPARFTHLYGLPVGHAEYERLLHVCAPEAYVDLSSTGGVLTLLRRIAVSEHLRRYDRPEDTARLFGVTVRYTRKLREKPALCAQVSPSGAEPGN